MFDWEKFASGKIAVYCEDRDILERFLLLMERRGLHHVEEMSIRRVADRGMSITIRGTKGFLPAVKFGTYLKHATMFGLEDEVNAVHVVDIELETLGIFDEPGFLDLIGIG